MHSMLHTKFQASEQSDFEEEDFYFFSMNFYCPNLGLLWRCHLGPAALI